MKPRGLDSCSYADLGTESAATETVDLKDGNLHLTVPILASICLSGCFSRPQEACSE